MYHMHSPLHYCDVLLSNQCEIMGVSFSLLALLKMSSKFVVQWKMSHSSRVNDNGLLQVDICLIFVCASDWNIKTNTTSFVWLLSIKGYIEWTVRGSVKDRLISCEYLSEGWGVGGGWGGGGVAYQPKEFWYLQEYLMKQQMSYVETSQ